jgi:colicin import membrane protein
MLGDDTSATRKAAAIRRPERLPPNSPKGKQAASNAWKKRAAAHADKAVEKALAALVKEQQKAQRFLDWLDKEEAVAKAKAAKAEGAVVVLKKKNADAAIKRAAEAKAAAAAKEAKDAAVAAKAAEKAVAEQKRMAALAKKNWWSDEFQASLSALKRGDPLPKPAAHAAYNWNARFTPIPVASPKNKSATRSAPTNSKLRAEFGLRPRGVKPAATFPKLRAPPSGRTRKAASKNASPDLLRFNNPKPASKMKEPNNPFDMFNTPRSKKKGVATTAFDA